MKKILATCLCFGTALITLSGCNLRVDTGIPPLPDLSIDQVARNNAAECEQNFGQAINASGLTKKHSAWASYAASAAKERLDAFGGVWKGWPGQRPEGGATPPPTAAAPSDSKDLLAEYSRCAAQAEVDAGAVSDALLAKMLLSASVARSLEGAELARAEKVPFEPTKVSQSQALRLNRKTGKYSTDSSKSPRTNASAPSASAKANQLPKDLLAGLDASRYQLEWAAANSEDLPTDSLTQAAEYLASEVDALAAAGPPDSRQVSYPTTSSAKECAQAALQNAGAWQLELAPTALYPHLQLANTLDRIYGADVALSANKTALPYLKQGKADGGQTKSAK